MLRQSIMQDQPHVIHFRVNCMYVLWCFKKERILLYITSLVPRTYDVRNTKSTMQQVFLPWSLLYGYSSWYCVYVCSKPITTYCISYRVVVMRIVFVEPFKAPLNVNSLLPLCSGHTLSCTEDLEFPREGEDISLSKPHCYSLQTMWSI